MSKTLTALFDGHVFYPDTAPDLEPNTHYLIMVQPVPTPGTEAGPPLPLPPGMPGEELLRLAGTWDARDLQAMSQAIEADCEQVNEDEW
jgi:hypothetical protein